MELNNVTHNQNNKYSGPIPDPIEIVIMLHETSIGYLKKAIKFGENGDLINKNLYAEKTKRIISDLDYILDMDAGGEIAETLRDLYLLISRHLMRVIKNDDQLALKEVLGWLDSQLESWKFVAQSGNNKHLENSDEFKPRSITVKNLD